MANKVNGNVSGVRATVLEKIVQLYDVKLNQQEFASYELLSSMAEYTALLNREISVYASRDGRIVDVSIGDSGKVSMPNMRLVRNEDRLCGVRCIHTHPSENGRPSDVDIGTLRSMRLDAMCSMAVIDGKPGPFYAAYLGDMEEGERQTLIYGPLRANKLPQRPLIAEIYIADERMKGSTHEVLENRAERAILVGIENAEGYDTLRELAELASTAGAEVVSTQLQHRRGIDNATYIGSGKVDELSLLASAVEADLFIFDDELSAIQLRNLEEALGARVIDRTALILDIFAARAQSREGKLQVELAQQKYRLPRLMGQGTELSRLGGGIGTRGPGEKKLEIDRRRIRRRIFELEEELGNIEKQRGLRRERREKNSVPLVALVGYTNAGKSTLLNLISGSDVLSEDKLFATLDPVVRQVTLKNGTDMILSDTVGFINKLPHDLIEAFKSTLEEVTNADLILHVVDSSSSYYDIQMRVVEDVLEKLGAADTPRINVYNKIDIPEAEPGCRGDHVCVSAVTGEGMDELMELVERKLNAGQLKAKLLIPYDKYEIISFIRSAGRILEENHTELGTEVVALLDEPALNKIKKQLPDVNQPM